MSVPGRSGYWMRYERDSHDDCQRVLAFDFGTITLNINKIYHSILLVDLGDF